MKLIKIKLVGFKSFVDPTTLELRSPLSAVVGPNGCGKSNIIDAVRWVMGESSAKTLRGESMADVIFNGSSTRKPVGQAVVELVFDNSDGSLGGEYARFSEISIRRVGSRDGQSSYFLNGTRCRRKDITDIFLGTGLGPRSYSIIEQGMISRIIEARPEELRAFVEEAAGISLYRKRRHETEIRMRHTRENLERLDDVRQELEKQLERLKRQSEAAGKYKQYKEEEEQITAELCAVRWRILNEHLETEGVRIRTLATELEEKIAARTHLELEIEKQRIVHTEKADAWKSLQSQYYDLGTEIARIEQKLQNHRERQLTLENDLRETQQNDQQIGGQIDEDQNRLRDLQQALMSLQPEYNEKEALAKIKEKILSEADEALRDWTQSFEAFQQEASGPQRTAEVEKTRIEQLEKQSLEARTSLARLSEEESTINIVQLEHQLEVLERELLTFEAKGETRTSEFQALSVELNQMKEALRLETERRDECGLRLQSLQTNQTQLLALQQAVLNKANPAVSEWLNKANLLNNPRLLDTFIVEKGYERAVETVLGSWFEAICVSGFNDVTTTISDLKEGNLVFLDTSRSAKKDALKKLELLATKVKTELPVQSLLSGVYIVSELTEALIKQKELECGESIVTLDGIWVGPNWLRVARRTAGDGILERESELKELEAKVAALRDETKEIENKVVYCRASIQDLDKQRESLHHAEQEEGRFGKELSSKVSGERARLENARNRCARLQSEMAEQKQKLMLAEEETALARLHLQAALDSMEDYSNRRAALLAGRDKLRDLQKEASRDAHNARENAHTLALKRETLMAQHTGLEEGLDRLAKQKQTIFDRHQSLLAQLQGLNNPQKELRQTLESLLAARLIKEEALNQARLVLDELEAGLRALEKKRAALEEEASQVRSQLEKLRIDWQGIQIRCQTVEEKLEQMGRKLDQILAILPKDAEESLWSSKLDQIVNRIERLGAINLAAIEEYQSESERKNYLDSQHKDLMEALETLENAIRKIDRETRSRFKDTYEKVNTEFQALFPRLFGGGQAHLELTGEDLLEAGVTVMARPPGKRNSSIHLLSGGEKALTAVAMVFAIFQLNPAPFCLLDEVDAPLDDVNVGRFCELVKRLSNSVQFIVVTHNKLAMEMAHHLVGVTMKEPGVSRLVSVDVEAAAALVAV